VTTATPAADGEAAAARPGRALALASVAVTIVPIVVAVVRGIRRGWIAIGDNAFFAVRARDVLTSHHPLVGTWTSASTSVGIDLNNPGPLFFDLLALPTKLFGDHGLAAGVAALNVACVIGIAVVAWRRGGPVTAAAAMVVASGLTWTMGSELLYDPWQPNALLLPFLLLLTLTWSALAGDLVALPWIVAVASLIVQTHFSYALLVALIGAVAVGAFVVEVVRHRDRHRPRAALGVGVTTVVVGLVCWAQPLDDQVRGFGNLGNLVTHAGGSPRTIGLDLGARLVAGIIALPPFWGRPSFRDGLSFFGPRTIPTTGAAVPALAVAVVVLLAVGVLALRRRDRELGMAAGLSLALITAAVVTSAVIPLGVFLVAPHQLRWLWPIGAFATFALLLALIRTAGRAVPTTVVVAVLTAVVTVLAVLNVPTFNARSGPTADAASIPPSRRLQARLAPLEGKGPLLLDTSGVRFADPYHLAVMAELQRRGIEFRVSDEGMVHQLGSSRRADGTERGSVLVRDREAALVTPPGATLVARVLGLPADQRADMERQQQEIAAYVADHGLPLNAQGRIARRLGALDGVTDAGVVAHPELFVQGSDFGLLVRRQLASIDPAWRPRIARYLALHERWERGTIAVFLAPLP
jgi:hypothetical protein